MSKSEALYDSLDEYLKRKAKENVKISYEDYTKKERALNESRYLDAVTKALTTRSLSSPTAGRGAERISSMGLSRGGLEELAGRTVSEDYRRAVSRAESDYITAKEKIGSGYRDYLQSYEKKQTDLERSLSNRLVDRGVADPDVIYRYAISAGLAPEAAESVSVTVSEAVKRHIYEKVMGEVITLRLDPENAELYAKSLGLGSKDALLIKEIAKSFADHNYVISQEYLDYLEKIGALTTGHGLHTSGNNANK